MVSETRHLDREQRRQVDKHIVDGGLADLSAGRAAAWAQQAAPTRPTRRVRAPGPHRPGDRRVGLRPAPDTMSVLTGFLPVEQGVACLAALRTHTDTVIATGDGRSRDQIMADTLVERLTGQATAADVNVEVGIVIPVDALLDPDSAGTAEVVGHGPVPAGIARDLLATTAADGGGGGCSPPPTRAR